MIDVKSIQCPKCKRDWPLITEQGIHTELHGDCHACAVSQIVAIRDKRQKDASYNVVDCPDCQSQQVLRKSCVACFGKGWMGVPKAATNGKG